MSFTNAAAASAAPSSAPNATAPPPSTPVMNAGSSGYTISLAKSLRRETAPNSLTCLGSRRQQRVYHLTREIVEKGNGTEQLDLPGEPLAITHPGRVPNGSM